MWDPAGTEPEAYIWQGVTADPAEAGKRTPEERADISNRMTAYWQRKREEKASSRK